MNGINRMYFGYANPRFGISVKGFDIVVLVDGDKSCTLQGDTARACIKMTSEATAHLCGVTYSHAIAALKSKVETHENDYPLYNHIFNQFWNSNTEQNKCI